MTCSELIFEQFCQMRQLRYRRVATGAQKTPDYDVYVGRRKIVVEIKQIDPNPEEQKTIKEFQQQKSISIKYPLGKRVRDKITDAAGKFRTRIKKRYPSLLVLYNNVELYKHTEPRDILAGMYGQLYFPVTVRRGKPSKIGNIKSGPKKKMTPTTNTSISALGVLKKGTHGTIHFSVYHNLHARLPLNPSLFARVGVPQYSVNDAANPTDWAEIKC